MPWLRKTRRSMVWMRLEIVTTSMPPMRSTAVAPRLDRLLHRARIVDRAEGHVLDAGIHQRLQHRRGVVVAATARIVGAVGDDQRAFLADTGFRRGDAVGDRPIVGLRPFLTPPPDLVYQLSRDRLGTRFRPGLVADRDRGAGVGNVGPG